MQFNLIGSKNYPGKVIATNITILEPSLRRDILKINRVDSEERFTALCLVLDKGKNSSEYIENAFLAYQISTPLYKLRLWIRKYTPEFDFDLFKKYHFRLQRQEAEAFKQYVKETIKSTKRGDFRRLAKSNLIQSDGEIRVFETSWRDIGFENGKIFIDVGTTESQLLSFPWYFSKDDFNLIVTGYITKRDLKSIKSRVNGNSILKIEGLEQLQDAIKTIGRARAKKTIDELIKEGWEPRKIREHPDFITLGNEDLLRLFGNHACIDYLQKIQSTSLDMPLIYVVEKKPTELGGITHESSYLFSILLQNNRVAIIWESVKLDRATQIFECEREAYFRVLNAIDDFLSSFETKKRSLLRANTIEGRTLRESLCHKASVEHTQYVFEKWLRNLQNVVGGLPEPNPVHSLKE